MTASREQDAFAESMASEFHSVDADGNALAVHSRVMMHGGSTEDAGTVVRITEPDGDTDGEGRTCGISPQVVVLFDDGVEDVFTTFSTARGPGDDQAPYRCDDLTVLA